VKFRRFVGWLGGSENLTEINRIFNIACVVATLFCLLSGIESIFASLSPILIANNFFYTIVLALSFYFSRFKKSYRSCRIISIVTLIFIYTPILWIYNGGIRSGIPYFILLFGSFLTVLSISRKETRANKTISAMVIGVFCAVVIGLILIEFAYPNIIYQYENQAVQITDIVISLVFALVGNYVIIMAFVYLYYRQLEKAEEYSQKLEALVIRDSMTNLFNHAFVVTRLSEEVARVARRYSALSVIMLDIDFFKKVNDTYGHLFGDEVIKQIAQTLHSNCRAIDTVARYGGEEFLIILPDTSSKMAVIIANRLLNLVQGLHFDNQITVTLSAGIAQYEVGDTASGIIEKADSHLYEAKLAGRNQIKY
jgi:diguanylate cyclase (GGDEF)-like protein